ncbi:hypothetical protein [Sinomonas mesophila]|uniref:hypothetical protein n=1 Tax=Sinomonas mesophila TaxID=1531955 RepID=UPI000986B3D2|nr:hypothetical protein [Sinomonas mesophila]
MALFLITYHGMAYPDIEYATASRKSFRAWAKEALGDALVEFGAPLLQSGQMAVGQPADAVEIDGYSIIRARSYGEARAMLEGHPFLKEGGTIQINECMEVDA